MVTRRPSLLGRTAKTVARTALVAGTATAVSGRVAGRQADAPQPVPLGLRPTLWTNCKSSPNCTPPACQPMRNCHAEGQDSGLMQMRLSRLAAA